MAAKKNILALEVLQRAQKQEVDFGVLFSSALAGGHAELQLEMKMAASAVAASLQEVLLPERTADFRKNFLVIAKSYNSTYRLLLKQCFEQECIGLELYNEASGKNQQLQNQLMSLIEQLQHSHGYHQQV